jgi:hypothetical protein
MDNRASSPDGNNRFPTDVINAARIRVSGIGGLGLVAMALVVAWNVPRIGQELAVGGLLGVALAAVLILRRRRTGPLPTSGGRPGANTVLSINESGAPETKTDAARHRDLQLIDALPRP